MTRAHNLFDPLQRFDLPDGTQGLFYSLPHWNESVLRNCDGKGLAESSVRALANWQAKAPRTEEIPFVVAQDGVGPHF